MMEKKAVAMVLLVAVLLFSGCTIIPGLPKLKAKNASTASTETTEAEALGCDDVNENGICDVEESAGGEEAEEESTTTSRTTITTSTTMAEVTTTSTEAASTTTSSSLANASNNQSCSVSSDCGEPYYSGCRCDANDVVRTMYKPMCVSGGCKWRTVDERTDCRKMTDVEGEESDESERCVTGYSRCITKEEADEYFTVPSGSGEIEDVDSSSFSEKYKGYSFKIKEGIETDESRCLDSVYFLVYVMSPDGVLYETEVAWNMTGSSGEIEFGINRVRRFSDRGYVLDLWVKEA